MSATNLPPLKFNSDLTVQQLPSQTLVSKLNTLNSELKQLLSQIGALLSNMTITNSKKKTLHLQAQMNSGQNKCSSLYSSLLQNSGILLLQQIATQLSNLLQTLSQGATQNLLNQETIKSQNHQTSNTGGQSQIRPAHFQSPAMW